MSKFENMSIEELEKLREEKLKGHEGFKKRQRVNFNRKRENQSEIIDDLKGYGFEEKVVDYTPIDRDLKLIIRTHASGFVDVAKAEFMSESFNKALTKPMNCTIHSSQYNLNSIKCWKYIKQFKEFDGFEAKIQKALSRRKINPAYLGKMNFEDIKFLLADYKSKNFDGKDHFPVIKEGAKSKAVKEFAQKYSGEFYNVLLRLYEGNESMAKIALFKARDFGKLPNDKKVTIEAHHNEMVTNAENLEDLSKINSPENFRFFEKSVHECIHKAFDHDRKNLKNNNKIRYFSMEDSILVCGRENEYKIKIAEKEAPRKISRVISLVDKRAVNPVRYSQQFMSQSYAR